MGCYRDQEDGNTEVDRGSRRSAENGCTEVESESKWGRLAVAGL